MRLAGKLVTYEELLKLFADVKEPWRTMWRTVGRYGSQLEGARIVLVRGKGYVLVEEEITTCQDRNAVEG